MRRIPSLTLTVAVFFLFFSSLASAQVTSSQPVQDLTVRKMTITGEIARGDNSYVIRGKVPAEIFTILNPEPKILDELVNNGKIVRLEVRIVSGDNVEIKKIDDKEYLPKPVK